MQTSQLITALTTERAALQQFVALLEQEQALLLENSTEALLALSEHKSEQALTLNEMAEERRAQLKKIIPELTIPALQDWLASHTPQGLSLWTELRHMAEQAQHLNSINGELILMKLRHNQQTLNVLNNAANKANVYGPDGQTTFSPSSGRSLGNG